MSNPQRTADVPVVGDMLLSGVTTVGAGNPVTGRPAKKTFQADLVGSGTFSATVVIEGSNTGSGWVAIGTIPLSNTVPADGFYFETPLALVRANVTAISGAGATVNCAMGS